MTISQFEYKYFLHLLELHIKEGDDVAWNFSSNCYLLKVSFDQERKLFVICVCFFFFFFCCRPTVAPKCGSEPTCGELSTSGKSADIVPY